MKRFLFRFVQALAAFFMLFHSALAADAQRDYSGFWNVKFEQAPSGKALFEKIPSDAVFIDDAGAGELAAGDYSGLVLSERAKQEVAAYDPLSEFARENTCVPPSVAFYMQAPFPIEIHQGRDLIVFKIEYFDLYRVIFMDGREHPEKAPHSKSGHSVGHWEGDELVVDTTHISLSTFMNNGFNHSENLHLRERFKLSEDGQTLWLIQLYEDKETFSGTAARYMAWRKVPGEFVYPYECDPSFGD